VGHAVARRLCAAGCHVVLNYARDDARARIAVDDLSELKGTATAVAGDVSRPTGFSALLDTVRREYGGLDIFVHNASSWHPMPVTRPDGGGLRADLATALTPLVCGAPVFSEVMSDRPGRIVAISSSGARSVVDGYASLGVAKAALESLVRYLAVELAGRGITVNAVSTAKVDKGVDEPRPDLVKALAARTPGGRLTTSDDIAGAVALLCTDEAAWIQGQVVVADGGLTLRA
jgi:enoyl-[acyl-carrier protein] reductase III